MEPSRNLNSHSAYDSALSATDWPVIGALMQLCWRSETLLKKIRRYLKVMGDEIGAMRYSGSSIELPELHAISLRNSEVITMIQQDIVEKKFQLKKLKIGAPIASWLLHVISMAVALSFYHFWLVTRGFLRGALGFVGCGVCYAFDCLRRWIVMKIDKKGSKLEQQIPALMSISRSTKLLSARVTDIMGLMSCLESNRRRLAFYGGEEGIKKQQDMKELLEELSLELELCVNMVDNLQRDVYATFTDPSLAKTYIKNQGAPIVVKADGLAAGKGVIAAMTLQEAFEAVDSIFTSKSLQEASKSF